MANVIIREAIKTDLARCLAVDPSYLTEHVWQMDSHTQNGQISVGFRPVKLPREMRVNYPRDAQLLTAGWQACDAILIADRPDGLAGYATLTKRVPQATVWINDLVVAKAVRRSGVAGALLRRIADWGRQQQLRWLVMELQTKNYPAICFCQKHGFKFCGFHDHYFANQDIALFFALALH